MKRSYRLLLFITVVILIFVVFPLFARQQSCGLYSASFGCDVIFYSAVALPFLSLIAGIVLFLNGFLKSKQAKIKKKHDWGLPVLGVVLILVYLLWNNIIPTGHIGLHWILVLFLSIAGMVLVVTGARKKNNSPSDRLALIMFGAVFILVGAVLFYSYR